MNELDFQGKSVLEILKDHVKSADDSAKVLDDKAQSNISISTIIVGIVGALNIDEASKGSDQQRLLICIFIIYGLVFLLSYFARRPRKFATQPIKPDWKELEEWRHLDQNKYYDKLISSYVAIVEKNKKINNLKAWLVSLGAWFILFDMVLIFLAALS